MSEEIRTGDMVLNSDLGPMEAGEIARSHVNARAIDAVCLLMDNSLDLETLMQVILQSSSWAHQTVLFAACARMSKQPGFPKFAPVEAELPSRSEHKQNRSLAALVPYRMAITLMCFDASALEAAAAEVFWPLTPPETGSPAMPRNGRRCRTAG